MKDFVMNGKKIVILLFVFGFVSSWLISMDDISRMAALYNTMDCMDYNIVDNGLGKKSTPYLGIMTEIRQKKQIQDIVNKRNEQKAKVANLREKIDMKLREKLENVHEDHEEDYSPFEVKSDLFFTHVTKHADEERKKIKDAVISPTSIDNAINSPKGILKKSIPTHKVN